MKKIISFFLVFIFSFTMISTSTQKKSEAITLVAGYTIAQILGSMALSATVVGAGYVIGDTLVNPDDNSEFTDFLQTVFKQTMDLHKYEIPPPPEPLGTLESVTLLSMLTKQGIEVGQDLYNMVRDHFQSQTVTNNIPLIENFHSERTKSAETISEGILTAPWYKINAIVNAANSSGIIAPVYRGKYIKINLSGLSTFIYIEFPEEGNIVKLIGRDNSVVTFPFPQTHLAISSNGLVTGGTLSWDNTTFGSISFGPDYVHGDNTEIETPPGIIPPITIKPYEDLPKAPFKHIDMTPLNGLVRDNQELIDIINGNKVVSDYKYGKITEAFNDIYEKYIRSPNIVIGDEPIIPSTDPNTGLKYYGDPKLGEPDVESDPMPDELTALNKALFWLKGIWQSIRDLPKNIVIEIGNIFQYLKNFIERFWQSFTEWWENNFLYHWTLFIDWLHTLPNFIANALTPLFDTLMIPVNGLVSILQNIWDWLQGFPDMLVGLIVPPDNEIAEVWEPVSDLFNQKIFPVIQPFQNIGFYEEELQDISADIKIGQYQGNHKIIDYSYLKSVREPIKSVIRSFFWILIIFFNLDQVHRLIRNQSIVKTYIRKVDEPGGNK